MVANVAAVETAHVSDVVEYTVDELVAGHRRHDMAVHTGSKRVKSAVVDNDLETVGIKEIDGQEANVREDVGLQFLKGELAYAGIQSTGTPFFGTLLIGTLPRLITSSWTDLRKP